MLVPAAHAAVAKERTTEGVGLTIYSAPADPNYGYQQQQVWNPTTQQYETLPNGYAVVKEWRKIKLTAGQNTLRFTDVAQHIDATTVNFKSLTDPKTAVLEQNFEYDLVSADKILSKYIDHPLTLVLEGDQEVSGTLMSFDAGQIVLKTDSQTEPIQILQRAMNVKNIKFGKLPAELITKPTLVWMLDASKAGDQLVRVTYETSAMSWTADYTAVISADDKSLDLNGWVTITNQSGGTYKDAELKLVAGDVNRVPTPGQQTQRERFADDETKSETESTGFKEKSFFEYHLYTLGRTTTLPNASIKQLELIKPAENIPAMKEYVYYGGPEWYGYGGGVYEDRNYGVTGSKKVDIYLSFKNDAKSKLGVPLPAGRVRVFKKDEADGSLELIGEDKIDHTPKDEQLRLKLGNAFDIVGERKQTDFKVDYDAKWLEETFEIKVRNHKDEDVTVLVRESLYRWVNWSVTKKSQDFEKQDAHTIHFPVKVKKNGETVVTYTVRYTW